MATRNMVNPVLSRAMADELLLAVRPGSATDPVIMTPKVALMMPSEVALTPDTTLAALQALEVAFTGYTAGGQALAFQAATVRYTPSVQALAGNLVWVMGSDDPLVTDDVGGWFLYDTTYGLICAEKFSESVSMGAVGDYLDLFVGLPLRLTA